MVATQEREANHGVFEITRGDVHVLMTGINAAILIEIVRGCRGDVLMLPTPFFVPPSSRCAPGQLHLTLQPMNRLANMPIVGHSLLRGKCRTLITLGPRL